MKKYLFIITVLCLFFLPIVVHAEGHCRVVSGNGNDLGSEIDCGGEHFYIFDKDDTNIKLLTKYNLYDGMEWDQVKVPGNRPGISGNEKAIELINKGYGYSEVGYDYNYQDDTSTYKFTKKVSETHKVIMLDGTSRTYGDILFLPEVIGFLEEGYVPVSSIIYNNLDYGLSEKINGEPYYTATAVHLVYDDNYVREVHMSDDSQCNLDITAVQNSEEYNQKIAAGYVFNTVGFSSTRNSSFIYCGYFYQKENELRTVKQDELAIGAHGAVRGVAEYPEHAAFYGDSASYANIDFEPNVSYPNDYSYVDFTFKPNTKAEIKTSMTQYKRYLTSLNVNVNDINLITVKEIDDFTYNTTNSRLPLADWTSNWEQGHHFTATFNIVGSLKDYIPEEYSWIWTTTYWTRTRNGDNMFFVDSWGDICNAYYCAVDVGAGIRPVVTIPKSELLFNIATETDSSGEIEVVDSSEGNKTISFKVSPNKGFKLKSIIITTNDGTVIEFTEGDITEKSDGTVSIMNNKFTMPFENVTIKANWEEVLDNPATDDSITKYCIILFVSFGTLLIINHKKEDLI